MEAQISWTRKMVSTILHERRQLRSIEFDAVRRKAFACDINSLVFVGRSPCHVYSDGVWFGRHTWHIYTVLVSSDAIQTQEADRKIKITHCPPNWRTSKKNSEKGRLFVSCFSFRDGMSLCNPGWPWIHNPPASVSWLQRSQTCTAYLAWSRVILLFLFISYVLLFL